MPYSKMTFHSRVLSYVFIRYMYTDIASGKFSTLSQRRSQPPYTRDMASVLTKAPYTCSIFDDSA